MKVTIITATFNSEKTVSQTIESVLKQSYTDYEHIIVDGLSKDSTMKIVKDYEDKYNGRLKYISEQDTGLYDAMNKGIKMATGDVIGILNSDDIFAHDNVLKEIVSKFEETNCDATYSDLIYMDNETMSKPQRVWKSPKGKLENGWHPAHPTLYLKRSVYDKIGYFNLKFKIAADYDLMVRIMKDKSINMQYINDVLVHMRTGGVSTNGLEGYVKSLKESNLVLKENKIKHPYIVNIKRILKTIKQVFIGKLIRK